MCKYNEETLKLAEEAFETLLEQGLSEEKAYEKVFGSQEEADRLKSINSDNTDNVLSM